MVQNPAVAGSMTAKPTVRSPFVAQLFALFMIWGMVRELNAVSGGSISALALFVPFYNFWWLISVLPGEAAKAKQRAGSKTPARGGFVYMLFAGYALAADLNDIAEGR